MYREWKGGDETKTFEKHCVRLWAVGYVVSDCELLELLDTWSADFDDLRVFSLAMQNKLELSVCVYVGCKCLESVDADNCILTLFFMVTIGCSREGYL